ncbi:trans-sulfuration enzyme family protein [Desulfofundulus sp.]|uniref:trans-sulfuration enzyme family protein n=1 Tax=Desulfofundulus sp. TaxID=2282750 RepID=UPI003C739D1D
MSQERYGGFATRAIHFANLKDEISGSLVTPIFQTNSYIFENVADGAAKCESFDNGYCYTRLGNPTQTVFEEKMAALEGGEQALAFASGTAAVSALLLYLFQTGDHAVVDETCYSSTHYLFNVLLRKFGVETTFVDTTSIKNVENALRENTRLIYFESPANPTLKVVDIKAIAELGKKYHILTAIDNTFATPYLQKPIDFGIDVVIHSATKYICGHGDAMGGVVVSTKEIITDLREVSLKNIGSVLSPFSAFLLIRGLKTLDVRMRKHCENALKIAKFLEDHPKIERVFYPGLPTHPQYEVARKQMRDFGGIVCFELKGGLKAGIKLMESVELCILAVSLGDCETLVEHPASMTHWYVDKKEREKAGITDGLVRLSTGLEDADDLIADLEQALAKI